MTPVTLGGKAWTYMDQATGEIITDYETLKKEPQTELERFQTENLRLRAENALLKKRRP